jgi:4-amino-4-deoxy-L-arabinose transferase-like glycosyltransferase
VSLSKLEPDAVRRALLRLLFAGAALQLFAAACVCVVGRFGVAANSLSQGGVLGGGDGGWYLDECIALGRHLSGLFAYSTQVHVRLYALSCAALAPLFGANVLSLELVNLPLYLLMLFLTFKIGETCYGARAGLFAAALVGLFPTLLLHSTQPFRDPLFIVLMLTLTWIMLRLITRRVSAASAAFHVACGVAVLLLIWLVREALSPIYFGMIALALGALLLASLRERRVLLSHLACLLLMLATLALVPRVFSTWLPPKEEMSPEQQEAIDKFMDEQTRAGRSGFILKLTLARQRFIVSYPDAGSNIDAGQTFRSPRDVVAYLPRAVLIGLFAPFPAQWIEEGKTYGRKGRIIAGLEMCFVYALTCFAAATVWRTRRLPQTWLLVSFVLLGATALGLVVVNVGTLYRIRYSFLILLIVVGAEQLSRSLSFKSRHVFAARA